MKDIKRFYYIDKDGNQKEYSGKILNEGNGTYVGILTTQELSEYEVELEFHPEVKPVDGYYSYYTYINKFGEEVRYYSIVKKDENGTAYFTYATPTERTLIYHPAETVSTTYFTYMVNGTERPYYGKVTCKNGIYYGMV